jgi:IS5 family transposase
MAGQPGFFDIDERLRELSSKGDDLERLKRLVDFELFRGDLEGAVPRADRCKGGRPPFDHVLMFKVLILQTMHSLSDERTEYLIKDRLSFMRFLGLGLADPVPDANTIWTFREALSKAGAIEVLFRRFDQALKMSGYLAMGGQIVDATIVAAPKQRNTTEEKQAIKQGRVPDAWQDKPANCPEGPRRALDGQILQSQATCEWHAAGRSCHSRFRIQEPRLDRPLPWTDPQMDGDGRRCL